MAFRPDSGRQQRVEGYIDVDFTKGDIVNGVPLKLFWLPPGAFDIAGHVQPLVVFNSATSDVLDIGTLASGNAYKDNGNIAALTDIALAGFPPDTSTGIWVYGTWVGTGAAPTTGKFRLIITYAVLQRAQFNHGEDQ